MTERADRENREALFALMHDHPDLPVVPMVHTEVVAADDYAYWMGGWGSSEITKFYLGDEKVHFYEPDDLDEVCQALNDVPYTESYEDAYEREDAVNLELYNALPWVEAIVVYIRLRD